IVEPIERLVFVLEPRAKRDRVTRSIADVHMTVELVIELPREDGVAVTVMLGQRGNDPIGKLEVLLRRVIVKPSRAMLHRDAVVIPSQHLGILMRDPRRPRIGWRAEDDPDLLLAAELDHAIEKVKLKMS